MTLSLRPYLARLYKQLVLDTKPGLHPALRCWDHQAGNPSLGGSPVGSDGTLPVQIEAPDSDRWQTGVQVQFLPRKLGTYRPGDY